MRRYPKSFVVAGRFDTRPGFPATDFEDRAREQGIRSERCDRGCCPRRVRSGPAARGRTSSRRCTRRRLRSASARGRGNRVVARGHGLDACGADAAREPATSGTSADPPRAFYDPHEAATSGRTRGPVRPVPEGIHPGPPRPPPATSGQRPDRLISNASRRALAGSSGCFGRPLQCSIRPSATSFFTPATGRARHFLAVARLFSHKRRGRRGRRVQEAARVNGSSSPEPGRRWRSCAPRRLERVVHRRRGRRGAARALPRRAGRS